MRVKVAYGVQLEEVPSKIKNLGSKALLELSKSIAALANASEDVTHDKAEFASAINSLDEARQKLTEADSIMTDMQHMLQGLQNYYNGEQDVSERGSTMDSSRNPNESSTHTRQG